MIMPITIIIAMNLEPFLVNAILAGFAVAVITGVMGCFVVWRRMAYFGDSLAHSALLGVALGFAVGIAVNIGIILICSVFALLLLWLQQKPGPQIGVVANQSESLRAQAWALHRAELTRAAGFAFEQPRFPQHR